jgi:hypothetical protein
MKPKLILSLVLLLFIMSSCHKEKELQFTLYVEPTGSLNICKDFIVTIDDQEKLSKQLCTAGLSPNVTTITFSILSGKHTLQTEVIQDSKIFNQVIDFNNSKKFGYLTYNYNTLEFSFHLSETGAID